MKGQVRLEIRKRRNRVLREALDESAKAYSQRFVGQTLPVLWESVSEVGEWGWQMEGWTDNYLRVSAFASSPRWNEIDRVQLVSEGNRGFPGKLYGCIEAKDPGKDETELE
jgi:tRNA A37 methylthiotransferase MiaB